MSGGGQGIFVNSVFSGGKTATTDFTLYVNPYLVAQNGGRYTKHIYIGSQRIVSKLGDFESYGADPRRVEKAGESFSGVKVNYEAKYKKALETVKENYAIFEVPYYGVDNDDYVNGLGFCCNPASDGASVAKAAAKNDNAELQQFYYHPDHLGSSSYISNLDGEVVQHIEYVPFGEVFLEEKNAKWNTPYLFTSKELDKETGMYYYGARYYDPKTSVFVSVDPLAERAPNWTPYRYSFNNPINYIDPDGRFETKAEAKEWAKENGIKTGWFRDHKISESDGVWSINNKSEAVSYSRDASLAGSSTMRSDGVVESIYGEVNKSFSTQASDAWNSTASRAIIPDKIGLSLSSSVTAFAGMSTGLTLDWITRGHDASAVPYVGLAVGGQAGTKVMADALIGIGIGYYATSDMRNLDPGEASMGLLGWSVYGSGGAGFVLGGAVTGTVGFSNSPFVSAPTWISGNISGGASIGAGATGGVSYTFPVFKSQFKKK